MGCVRIAATLALSIAPACLVCLPGCDSKAATETKRAEASVADVRPNIVLILADDMGVDLLRSYGRAPNPPCTPHIDAMARRGLLFRNVWATPLCSPTRAQILTGRYGFRTGLGQGVKISEPETPGLTESLLTLPKVLKGYDTSAVGKWHIASPAQGPDHPNKVGFAHYSGSLFNLMEKGGGYANWLKTTQGEIERTQTYATTDTVNDAVRRAREMKPPWFLYVAFNAPHLPAHTPPDDLCPQECETSFCSGGREGSVTTQIKAAVEAMDTELGRMLAEIRGIDPEVVVMFVGDNGSASEVTQRPFSVAHAKGTMYEGGIHVPLIIEMNGAATGECDALVSTVDLFATVCELAGIEAPTEDSVSLVPYLRGSAAKSIRGTVFSERFSPNYDLTQSAFAPRQHRRAVRDARYKLIRDARNGRETDEFYDLVDDPFEQQNLVKRMTDEQRAHFDTLVSELARLGVE